MHTSRSAPLINLLWPAAAGYAPARAVALAFAGTLLLTASAKAQIPFWPVPMTMQTMVVLLLGMAYGAKLAAATMLLYLAQGALALPVFAGTPEKGVGLAYMLGPTGGYLAGFVLAAVLCGWLAARGGARGFFAVAATMAAGNAVIYACGLAWLATFVDGDKLLPLGVLPFLPADLLKIALAALLLPWAVKNLPRAKAKKRGGGE